jgi:hypothetical protein
MSNSEMNTNIVLNIENQQTERLDSINMTDIEAQNSVIIEKPLEIPLKGILKKSEGVTIGDHSAGVIMGMKFCMTILVLIIMTPIIVADLYFGFTDNSCINDEPENLAISMKLYLIVSGFVGMGTMIGILISICCLSFDDQTVIINMCCMSCIVVGAEIFHIVWNILGAIVFWGTIYGEGNCDKNVSTYIFVSLIIKFVSNLIGIMQNKSEKKK